MSELTIIERLRYEECDGECIQPCYIHKKVREDAAAEIERLAARLAEAERLLREARSRVFYMSSGTRRKQRDRLLRRRNCGISRRVRLGRLCDSRGPQASSGSGGTEVTRILKKYRAEWISRQGAEDATDCDYSIADFDTIALAKREAIRNGRACGAVEWARVSELVLNTYRDRSVPFMRWEESRAWTGDWSGNWHMIRPAPTARATDGD